MRQEPLEHLLRGRRGGYGLRNGKRNKQADGKEGNCEQSRGKHEYQCSE
jgi:hypothetical protein